MTPDALDLIAEDGTYRGEPNHWDGIDLSLTDMMIDNVWITGAEAPVPEPTHLLALLIGLLLLPLTCRARGRSAKR